MILTTVKVILDKVMILPEGRIIEQGEKKEILEPPHHEYTDKFQAFVPEMDPGRLEKLLNERASAFINQ